MRKHSRIPSRLIVVHCAVVIALSLAALVRPQPPASPTSGKLDELQVTFESLKGNLLGDPAAQRIAIYLPPGYENVPAKRYPTLYLLHGYSDSPEVWTKSGYQEMSLQPVMDSLIAKGVAAEMIVVVPNGGNAYFGSFYTNSPVTGNWEDYIYRELVTYVDKNYRTIAQAHSRGIAGHSMGGYGAFMIAMKHPDVFGAVYSMSPCCLGFEGDITADNAAWGLAAMVTSRDIFKQKPQSIDAFWTDAMIAVSAAFSPNSAKAPIYVDLPFKKKEGLLVKNEPAYSNFRSKMPLYLIEQYRENLMKLRGIILDVGEIDEFTHIRRTTAKLSSELSDREIPHAFEIYKDGNHGNKIRERFETSVIPFFSKTLVK